MPSENWLGIRELQTHIFGRAASAAVQRPNCVVAMLPSSRRQLTVMVNSNFASSSIRQPNIAWGRRVVSDTRLVAGADEVKSAIKSGGLNLEHSYIYRPLDDYLIDRARWQRDKQQLIERAGLEAFVDPRKVLDELDEAVHRQYLITNGNIIEGKNPHIKFDKNGGFTLATSKQEESDAEPLQHFFPRGSVAESPNHRKDHRHKAFSPLKVTLPSKGERRKLWR
jgi:hypothetical protein